VDSLLSHVDARWQLVPVKFHCRGSINVEPIPVIMAHRRSLRAQALPHRGICIWRTSKQAPSCRQLNRSSVIRALHCSAPDGEQHCTDHDTSGGMRKSGYDVDDAGDASNTEIGHVAYLPSRTSIAVNTACAILPNPGLPRAKRESGEWALAGSQTGYRLERQQLRCQTRLALPCESRDHRPLPTGRRDSP
jgi:hypothetical protein